MRSFGKYLLVLTMILAVIVGKYYMPIHLPGPMVHPWKYKIISGTFAIVLDLVSDEKDFSRVNGS